MSDVYYAPEKFGLTIVAEEDAGGGYDFDKFVVWKDEAGQLYYGTDAGCSCPSPFDYIGISDLTKATKYEVMAAAQEWAEDNYRGVYDPETKTYVFDATELIQKVMAL